MPDCKVCKTERRQADSVPRIVHESDMARQSDTIKKLWIALIISILIGATSNLAWVIYDHQFVTESSEIEVDTGDGDAYVAGIGDVTVGESKNQSQDPDT